MKLDKKIVQEKFGTGASYVSGHIRLVKPKENISYSSDSNWVELVIIIFFIIVAGGILWFINKMSGGI